MPGPIYIEQGSWIAARAVIGPGVTVERGAVLGLGSVTGKPLTAMTIYAGNPAQPVKQRQELYPEPIAASSKGLNIGENDYLLAH